MIKQGIRLTQSQSSFRKLGEAITTTKTLEAVFMVLFFLMQFV